jgi:hypothetical protein
MTKARDVADTQENNGGGVAPFVAGKNAVINGAFQNWQRGTSVAVAASVLNTYTTDRWSLYTNANQACVVSRQATSDTTNLPFIQYCARVQRNSGQTGTAQISLDQSIETMNSIPFIGKTVTYSFYARKGANFSASSSNLPVQLIGGTGTDQNVSTATGLSVIASSSTVLTTTWQRFSATATVGSSFTQLFLRVAFIPTGTAGANDYFEITGVQLEAGNVATPFTTATGTVQGELAACQRYYYQAGGDSNYQMLGQGAGQSTTQAGILIQIPTQMRVTPTSVNFSTLGVQPFGTGTITAVTSLVVDTISTKMIPVANVTVASGLTQGTMYRLITNNSTSGYLGFSAEL